MKNKALKKTIQHVLMITFALIMIYPLVWMVSSSLKESSSVFVDAHSLIPKEFHFDNYVAGWKGFGGITFGTFFWNSTIISVLATVGSIISSTVIAYGFARIKFAGKKIWFVSMMLTMMLPFEMVMIPQYIMFNTFGWLDTYLPLILPTFFGIPFFIFLIMQFIKTIPKELDEAAKIDGCNNFQIFYRIIVPLVVPAMMTSAIFSFYWRWDDFMGPLIYLSTPEKYPVSLALKLFSDPNSVTNWGAMFAMSTLSILPIFIIFFFFQRYIVDGISSSGLKG
ncbi:putative ABC transporter permease protein YesQ [Thalassobacillus devorans]|uniref:ABC transporter permease protein YesQ n=1 Tax=Thalassobacillus devorans TaxID=279813 RepID=A0ABQ1NVW0_9BACI|nr:carbohydrate ABC transporter permease [Thalassobacillus devorans]NIK28730.1 multiple sugar transport system permease protein [Thalassobacillus devorans]GGC83999.1 putative ABC transporter permease protein YesQ [Thalassobacillus devorans]